MPLSIKELVVVLFLGIAAFLAMRPYCARFIEAQDYSRRRNLWIALTSIAFLSPSFWIFSALAFPLLILFMQQERNPAALYVLLYYLIPSYNLPIPLPGFNNLFDLSYHRLIAFAILVPAAYRIYLARPPERGIGLRIADSLIILYIVLQVAVMVPHESITSLMRRTLLLGLDTFLLYYVFSRTPLDRRIFREVLVCVALSAVLLAPMAVFESLRAWLLYSNLGYQWGTPDIFGYLVRDGRLRAQVSTGHALYLGYLMVFAMAVALYLRHHILKRWWSHAVLLVLGAGLLASLSRGPMVAAVLMVFVLMAMGPRGGATVAKFTAGFAVVFGLVLVSPMGDKVIDFLPFVGSINAESVDYRTQLLDTALMLIPQNLMFGDPFVLSQMEHLRQGQGIIDLVNGYILVALYFGMVGLTLFVGLMVAAIVMAARAWWAARSIDLDLSLIGASLLACMLGTLLYIFTTGFYPIHYILIGLMLSYPRLRAVSAVRESVASEPEQAVAVRRPYAMPPLPERQAGGGRASARRTT
jgi:hypothetical protein